MLDAATVGVPMFALKAADGFARERGVRHRASRDLSAYGHSIGLCWE